MRTNRSATLNYFRFALSKMEVQIQVVTDATRFGQPPSIEELP